MHLYIYTPFGHQSSRDFTRSTRKQFINITLTENDFDDSGVTEIYFESDALFRPNEFSRSADDRKIGFRFIRLEIGDTPASQTSEPAGDIRLARRSLTGLLQRTMALRTRSLKN